MAAKVGSPCGACKFLRRKCASDCIFAPYFCSEQGLARFAAIHKVFGASNVSKLLLQLPVHDRFEAVATIAYHAQSRVHDPVYGCVSHIFALQQQVAYLQAQLMQAKALILANNLRVIDNRTMEIQWNGPSTGHTYPTMQPTFPTTISEAHNYEINPISPPQSSIDESIDQQQGVHGHDDMDGVIQPKSEGIVGKKRSHNDMSELQELAFRMMKS